MSDGCQSTTSRPIINVILGVDGMLSLRLATDCSGKDKTMEFICDLVSKVIEDLGPANIFSVVMEVSWETRSRTHKPGPEGEFGWRTDDLLLWDIELVIDEPVDEQEEEPEA